MRIYGELFEAFEELWSAIYDVRTACTRRQLRRLEEAVETLRVIVKVIPDERPLVIPETDDPASSPPAQSGSGA